MVHSYSVASLHGEAESNSSSFDHQLYKIRIHQTEPNLFGPAFIEVYASDMFSVFIFSILFHFMCIVCFSQFFVSKRPLIMNNSFGLLSPVLVVYFFCGFEFTLFRSS